MSSTSRVGFAIPAVSDQADQILYHDNNVTVYEAELPSAIAPSLPASGNYSGRVRALNNAQTTNPPFPSMPYDEYVYNGSAWIPYSAAGLKRQITKSNPTDSGTVIYSGSEVFSAAMPGFNQITVQNGSIVKFMCQVHLGNDTRAGSNPGFGFNGKFNIFVNSSTSTQPGPLTVGAARLSFPIAQSDNIYTNGVEDGGLDYVYGELFYPATFTGTIGVGSYISTTYTENSSPFYIHDPSIDGGISPAPISFSGTQILNEMAGIWSA